MDRIIDFQAGRKTVAVPFRRQACGIAVKAGQRSVPLPFYAGGTWIEYTAEKENIYFLFRAKVPIVVDVHDLRIGELDPKTIGQLDPYPVPDAG